VVVTKLSSRVVKAREAFMCQDTWRIRPFAGHEVPSERASFDADEANAQVVDPAQLIEIAKRKAEAIIKDSLASAAEISKEARQQGFESGRQDGFEAGQAEVRELLDRAREEALEVKKARQEVFAAAESDIAMLAVKIASLIVKREVVQEPESIVFMVRDALRRVRDEDSVTVRLNPTDAVVVKGSVADLIVSTGARNINIVEDPTMGPADCIVSTPRGEIDERPDRQLRRIESALRSVDTDGAIE
jgi:flagellar assembly protein FliH